MSLKARLAEAVAEANLLKERLVAEQAGQVEKAARLLSETLKRGGKILLFGNGGSAADAQHLAAEFVNRFQIERPPWRPWPSLRTPPFSPASPTITIFWRSSPNKSRPWGGRGRGPGT